MPRLRLMLAKLELTPSEEWTARQGSKADGGLTALADWIGEKRFFVDNAFGFGLAAIAAGSVLGYLKVRFPEHPWRETYPHLARYSEDPMNTIPTHPRDRGLATGWSRLQRGPHQSWVSLMMKWCTIAETLCELVSVSLSNIATSCYQRLLTKSRNTFCFKEKKWLVLYNLPILGIDARSCCPCMLSRGQR